MDKSTQINVCTFCLGDKRTTLVNEPTPLSYSLSSSSSSSQLVAATATESKSTGDYYTTTNTKTIPTAQKQQQKSNNQTKSASNGASSKKKADLKLAATNSIKYEYDMDYGTTNLAAAYHPKKKFISNSHYNN